MRRLMLRLAPVLLIAAFATAGLASSAAASVVTVPLYSGTQNGAGSPDTHVQVVLDSAGMQPVPRPAINVNPQPSYYFPPPGTNWIAPYWDGGVQGYGKAGTYTNYETQFFLPVNATNTSVSVSVATDNQTTAIKVNGGPSFGQQTYPCPSDISNFNKTPPDSFTTPPNTGFVNGTMNTLTFETLNCESFDYGALLFYGSLSYTPSPVTEDECENGGWNNVVDSNGNKINFASQDACTAAATGTTPNALPNGGRCNNQLILGNVNGDVTVPTNGRCVLGTTAHLSHDVTVGQGGMLWVEGHAWIGNNLSANHPGGIDVDKDSTVIHDLTVNGLMGSAGGYQENEICGASVNHDLSVQGGLASAVWMQIGCPDEGDGNNVGHDMTVQGNAEPVYVEDNKVTHNANCTFTGGGGGSGNTPTGSRCNT